MQTDLTAQAVVTGWVLALAFINPYAAIGASFGCVFFLQYPSAQSVAGKLWSCALTWAIGYGAGTFWYGSGPPWLPQAFLPSLIAAALGTFVLTASAAMISNNGGLPLWADTLLTKLLPWRK